MLIDQSLCRPTYPNFPPAPIGYVRRFFDDEGFKENLRQYFVPTDDGVLTNAFYELESFFIDGVRKSVCTHR